MTLILRLIGWPLVSLSAAIACVKLFGDPDLVQDFGGSRDIDGNLIAIAWGIVFLALGHIIARMNRIIADLGRDDE
ncbi:MAG: hypothetical protein CML03_10175 [Pseudooceanicola sp.]|nr:hypothetical protein [Pseudooceanicola sp.]